MGETIRCSACDQMLEVPESLMGQRVKCPSCGHIFLADSEGVQSALPAVAARYETEEEIPARLRMGAARFASSQPHRGATILVLGILSIVICGPVGIAAWVMGTNDLAAMQRGEMDPSGEGLTRAGQILGIIATILMVVGFCIFGLIILGGGLR